MRVLFFGTPSFAAPTLAALLASRHTVAGVVTQPDRARGRGQKVTFSPVKALAMANNLPVFQPDTLKTDETLDAIRRFGADIGVVAAYGKILPQRLLDIPPQGLINVHASLLPRWRGAAPIQRAILAGDTVTGVTIMRVVFALDAGAMLSKVEVPIGENVTSVELEAELAAKGAELLVGTLEQLERGTASEVAQDPDLATYATKIDRADGPIDWSRSAREIHNQIRGLHPWPLASTTFRGQRLIIRASRVSNTHSGHVGPGTIIELGDQAITIATGAGTLDATVIQPESRKPQTAREFASGVRLQRGERFA
ncbi:MAG: methionyl-tRNA formyltransferase [Acidobacteria bacterium]|nr:MAG: methionyl-tRNA formyltransferase [Acidobacteriota bacterium]